MSLVNRPRREDYFPGTKRGHGSQHPRSRVVEGITVRKANPCVDHSCQLNAPKSSNLHIDQEANMRDWCEEHGLSLKSKDRPRGEHHTPYGAMMAATGGR